ncbi:MAG: transcriptional repressor LexA [Thermoanaerobaculia bacterium]
MAKYLTERQKQILDFIRESIEARGVSPTHREICDRFGYSSYGTVNKHLKLLEDKGFLRRHWNQKRGVELAEPESTETGGLCQLPFLGLIAAGQPIEAVADHDRVDVPEHLLTRRNGDNHFVLKVRGDSMIDEGIHDGDLVVVQRREAATAGEMVVALVGADATLKRFYPEGPEVRLQPANHTMQPIMVPAADVRIQGIVVGLMRRF